MCLLTPTSPAMKWMRKYMPRHLQIKRLGNDTKNSTTRNEGVQSPSQALIAAQPNHNLDTHVTSESQLLCVAYVQAGKVDCHTNRNLHNKPANTCATDNSSVIRPMHVKPCLTFMAITTPKPMNVPANCAHFWQGIHNHKKHNRLAIPLYAHPRLRILSQNKRCQVFSKESVARARTFVSVDFPPKAACIRA